MESIDWRALAAAGLVREINEKVLHPLGIAVFYDPKTGISEGAYVSPPDHVFSYADAATRDRSMEVSRGRS
ncbi:hypothetical protein BcepSauron_445 [Burkholderia phage BcepSauron]|uniref:DUF7415 domain-containing protein n=2 Tax=Sarumanvirus TaxID=2843450 RepID=A0A482MMB4_9CAUD|nr:hypothetical protein H1O16_gp443 [Burkholderia phage BcepSaruman]YP_009904823.1 hypothetical protein H1O17_gp445 [Burkholderia phage BcepSauron]QBQ74825.1 hypothetical protein BcepSauron_445 [Burkholderia phage BcepSauron]QBX06856.1 hypothetical protein BcepSaruman_443 [Burkholderia phage BcepSaruman]